MTTTVEFAVQISCDSCVTKIESSLKDVQGVKNIKVSKENGTVLVESNLPSTLLQEKIESTGRKAVLKGYGSDQGEREEFNFVKVEVDSSGCCAICKPSPTDSSKNMLDLGKNTQSSPPISDKSKSIEDNKEESVSNAKAESASPPPKILSKSDDEEELELKYSSDSEDGDIEARLNAFNTTEGEDIWKIEDDLDADFDVIDADGDESESEDKNTADGEKDEMDNLNDLRESKVNRTNSQTSINAVDSDNENNKSDDCKPSGKKRKVNMACNKFMAGIKACKVRKGDFNVLNTHIALHMLVLPEKEGEHLEESEAQTIKDNLVRELFLGTQRVLNKEPNAFILRFSDCKIVKPGWLLINCENKETFNWLLSWKVPSIDGKAFQVVPALDKSPLQNIKFSIKSKWIPDAETMLKLIHLQNRDIDTKRWVLEEKKTVQNGMEQFRYMVDFGSVRALEKLNWSFFYELFSVKVTEYNGKPVTSLLRNKTSKNIST